MLLNAGMDEIPEATVHVRLSARRVRMLTVGRRELELDFAAEPTGLRLRLKDIEPWGLRVLLLD